MTSARRGTAAAAAVAVLGVLAGGLLLLLASAAPAQASAYRYWTYWWGKPGATSWSFANLGPAGHKVADRSVEGWRFAVSTTTGGKQPRTSASWEDHCTGDAVDGKVRAAVVVDYGSTSDAPPGQTPPGGGTVRVECVTLATGSTGLDALRAAGVSYDIQKGLVCSLDGYPKDECAAVVADPTPTPTRTTSSPKPKPSASRTTAAPGSGSTAGGSLTPATTPASTPADRTSSAASTSAPASSPAASTADATTEAASPEAEPTLPVSSGSPVAAAPEDGGGSATGFVVGALVALGIGGAAWWTARGRSA